MVARHDKPGFLLREVGLLSLVLSAFQAQSQAQSPTDRERLVQEVQRTEQPMAEAGGRIAQAVSYVFMGRPITGENQRDCSGRVYHTTVVQVLKVLRGEKRIKPGTIAITDTIGTGRAPALGHTPTRAELAQERGSDWYDFGTWGYTLYSTTNRVILVPHRTKYTPLARPERLNEPATEL